MESDLSKSFFSRVYRSLTSVGQADVVYPSLPILMISKKVIVGISKFGKGLFANENIKKDEMILIFEGRMRSSQDFAFLTKDIDDHAVQISENEWIEITDDARFMNHSCEPNCGIKGKAKVVAMRDIEKGEELTFDYDMTENSDWVLECKCGSKNCRKIIQGYKHLPEEVKNKYNGYISDWLVKNDLPK